MESSKYNRPTSRDHSGRAAKKLFGFDPYESKEQRAKKFTGDPRFMLKVPDSQKTDEWYRSIANSIVPSRGATIDDYDEMIKNYEIYNGNLDRLTDTFKKFCNPLGNNILEEMDEPLQPYPILHNKVNVLKGEMLKRNDDFKVILLSAKAIRDKNDQMLAALKASVREEIALEIKKMEMQMSNMHPDDVNRQIEAMREEATPKDIMHKEFLSESEIFYNAVLKHARHSQEIARKKMETFEDVITADRCFVYSGWRFGQPYLEVRNPLHTGFTKSPNHFKTQKGDHVFHKRAITVGDAYTLYQSWLSDDDLYDLGVRAHGNNTRVDARHDIKSGLSIPVFDTATEEAFVALDGSGRNASIDDKDVGLHQGQGLNYRYNKEQLIWETHIEFKAFTEIDFLSYTDEYNEEVTIELKDFTIPESAKREKYVNRYGDEAEQWVWFDEIMQVEYRLERMWIPRKYEVIRLGDDIYPIMREVPFQVTNLADPYGSFELSTKGAIFTSRNAKSVSLLQRAVPLYMQYLYLKHVQNRELSKYQGFIQDIDVDQIPDTLGQDVDGTPIRDKVSTYLKLIRKTGLNFHSSSQTSLDGSLPHTRSPGSSGHMIGTALELYNLQNMIDLIEREISMAIGISPERQAQFSKGSNVTDNQQSIVQSHHITEPYFYLHSEVWKDALKDYMINFNTYCRRIFEREPQLKEHPLHYIMPNGTRELLMVTPRMLNFMDIALAASNGGNDEEYRNIMLQSVHAFSQNQGEGMEAISALTKALSNNESPEEIHKMISIEASKQRERQAAIEESNQKAQAEIARMAERQQQEQRQHEVDLVVEKGNQDRLTKQTPDANSAEGESGPTQVDVQKMNNDTAKVAQTDRQLAETERSNKAKENETKRHNLAQEQIAKQKPSPKSGE